MSEIFRFKNFPVYQKARKFRKEISVNEVVPCLDAVLDDGYITEQEHYRYHVQAENIYRQLRAFSASVRSNKRKDKKAVEPKDTEDGL